VAVVALAYPKAALPRPLDGYGYLIPAREGASSLGAVWESSLFPERAPAGHVLVRVMVGGARHPGAISESDDALVRRARGDVARYMRIAAEPERVWVVRRPAAIAQYVAGHRARVLEIQQAAGRHPGLTLCGTSYDGVSLGSAISAGVRAADALLARPHPVADQEPGQPRMAHPRSPLDAPPTRATEEVRG
jgi:oxygen-dependent protoporphyrinogen oxidase